MTIRRFDSPHSGVPQEYSTLSGKYPNARVWLPAMGGRSLDGTVALTQAAGFGVIGSSTSGLTFEHAGADFNNGWVVPGLGINSGAAILIIMGRAPTAGSNLYIAVEDALFAQSGATPAFYTFSTIRLQGALLIGPGSVILAQSKSTKLALGHKDSSGKVEILRSTSTSSNTWRDAGNICRYANSGIALLVQIPNVDLSDAEIEELLRDPINTLFQPDAIFRQMYSDNLVPVLSNGLIYYVTPTTVRPRVTLTF